LEVKGVYLVSKMIAAKNVRQIKQFFVTNNILIYLRLYFMSLETGNGTKNTRYIMQKQIHSVIIAVEAKVKGSEMRTGEYVTIAYK
jgi:hypothetical protein